MASSNIKLFDENKGNMLTDTEFDISAQRLNGLQTGIASSKLQNKAMYQASLVAYAIAQVMMQNGKNANDTDAVSAFVANLSGTMLQKVYDIATTEEAQAGVATGKWMSPALVKAAIDKTLSDKNFLQKSGGTMTGPLTISKSDYPDLNLKNTGSRSATKIRNYAHRTQIMSQEDDSNYRSLTLNDKSVTTDARSILQIQQIDGGVQTAAYNVLHTGNLSDLRVARIAIGSYVGTGTHGANNPNSLTFDFVPKAVFMIGTKNSDGVHKAYMFGYDTGGNGLSQHTAMYYDLLTTNYVVDVGFGMPYGGSSKQYGKRSDDGKTFSWYADYSSSYQLNDAGTTYYYMALY